MKFAILLTGVFCVWISACADTVPPPTITIMTMNPENLFDNIDDPGKDDKAFLPLSAKQSPEHIAECNQISTRSWREECLDLDWSDDAVRHKLETLASVILQIDRGADIITFQEVENFSILERLRTDYLADSGYRPPILIEGNDVRGIDVAILSKLPLIATPVLHDMEFENFPERAGDTRGILQAQFELPDGSPLTVFAVHFPAPYHPVDMRIEAYRFLQRLREQLPADHHVLAAGDFNTIRTEMYDDGLLERYVRPDWIVAHDSCDACPGTYYYPPDDNWSFLDMILYSPPRSENTTWRFRADSVRLVNGLDVQVTREGRPRRYRLSDGDGVSDHWPLAASIELATKQ